MRATHRVAATAATPLLLVAAWLAWRGGRRALGGGIALLTVGLSALGAATGISPPPVAQAGNLLGGLALAALLARLFSQERPAWLLLVLLAVQAVLGAWLSIFAAELWSVPLLAHATLGLALAGAVAWFSLLHRKFLVLFVALAVPAAGIAAALLGAPLAASLAHAAAAALLVVLLARAHARFA